VKDKVVQSLYKLRVHFNDYGLVTMYTSTPGSSPNTLIRKYFKVLVARALFNVETGMQYCAMCKVITREAVLKVRVMLTGVYGAI